MRRPVAARAAAAAADLGVAAAAKKRSVPTAYELRVHELCKLIPRGKVTTYGDMAKVLNSSARAVGQAVRRNPFAPVVPCHRVVAADLTLGGFSGSWGAECATVKRKRAMLLDEGVDISLDKIAAHCCVKAEALRKLLQPQP